MKLSPTNRRLVAGILLVECLVYIGLLFVIVGVGFVAFERCRVSSLALQKNADDITRALSAGEHWRADIRRATGRITVENQPDGQVVRIPTEQSEVLYRFAANRVERRLSAADGWTALLPKVKASHMEADNRSHVKAWRWELELSPVSAKTRLRPLFTFEAVPTVAP